MGLQIGPRFSKTFKIALKSVIFIQSYDPSGTLTDTADVNKQKAPGQHTGEPSAAATRTESLSGGDAGGTLTDTADVNKQKNQRQKTQ